jgi:hypothetical protein
MILSMLPSVSCSLPPHLFVLVSLSLTTIFVLLNP